MSCIVGSSPARATIDAPARGDMWALAVGLSVTFTASAQPTSSRACRSTGAGSAERGGTTSDVTQNPPARANAWRWLEGSLTAP